MEARVYRFLILVLAVATATSARADAVMEWNARANEIITASRQSGVAMYQTAAVVQVAVFDAVSSIKDAPDASVDAAVAAATRGVLIKLVPEQAPAIEAAYDAKLRTLPNGPAKTKGIAAGESAATTLLASRAQMDSPAPDTYRPHAVPGVYVPTTLPTGTSWSRRKPWLIVRGDQFRPGPPPSLDSDVWARDFNETKLLGGKESTRRTAEQTDIARFWSAVTPALYFEVVRSAIDTPSSRDAVAENARLLAIVAMAMDDALIAVLDAKYTYNLWRPITAIRNGDIDSNPRTDRDASWGPLIETPLHPEYPCAHCILASTVATIVQPRPGGDSALKLRSVSPNAPGVVRTWTRVADLTQEVAMARIYAGVHYRNSTEVGIAMGKRIGELALSQQDLPRQASRQDPPPREPSPSAAHSALSLVSQSPTIPTGIESNPRRERLASAIQSGDFELVRAHLDAGGDVNEVWRDSPLQIVRSLLLRSVWYGREKIFKSLLDRGADVASVNGYLDVAVSSGRVEIVRTLLARGLKPGNTEELLHSALNGQNMAIIELLWSADFARGHIPLPSVHVLTNDITRFLVPKYVSPNVQLMVIGSETCDVEHLLNPGAEIEDGCEASAGPLWMHFVVMGDTEVLQYLIDQGADLEKRGEAVGGPWGPGRRFSAMDIAGARGDEPMIELLRRAGVTEN
jgi:hypothetical protein